jgi:hypothetical protein
MWLLKCGEAKKVCNQTLFSSKASSSQPVCAAVAPVETTSEVSYVRTEKVRNAPAAAV